MTDHGVAMRHPALSITSRPTGRVSFRNRITMDSADGMVTIWTGDDDSIAAFSCSGMDVLKELIADIRTCDGGIRQFLIDRKCDDKSIARIMIDELRS